MNILRTEQSRSTKQKNSYPLPQYIKFCEVILLQRRSSSEVVILWERFLFFLSKETLTVYCQACYYTPCKHESLIAIEKLVFSKVGSWRSLNICWKWTPLKIDLDLEKRFLQGLYVDMKCSSLTSSPFL